MLTSAAAADGWRRRIAKLRKTKSVVTPQLEWVRRTED